MSADKEAPKQWISSASTSGGQFRIVMAPCVVQALRDASAATLGAETIGERLARRFLAEQRKHYSWAERQRGRRPLT